MQELQPRMMELQMNQTLHKIHLFGLWLLLVNKVEIKFLARVVFSSISFQNFKFYGMTAMIQKNLAIA